ncbi:HEAT repeat domain-containing protein [Nannocystis punicea]|uniref:HEAT repeat domain-containing protein n=1 Tax=Nannocystis punicea TaxID=2995304 RepID=A0ABY7HDN6_9BACT|nr:HEAT repeat domain-containing protein [Nannocystis poenicansa]WAS97387.1 HEAT repeat domain-containing protein [Nannocystis poenicansa]
MPLHDDRPPRRLALRTVTTLALVAGAAWAVQGVTRTLAPSSDDARALPGPQFGAALLGRLADEPRPPCRFAAGTRMAYDVVGETRVEIDFARVSDGVDAGANAQVEASPPEAHHVERRWHLDLLALAEEDGAGVLAARIADRGARVIGGEAPAAGSSPALSDIFLIRVDERCAIREFGWRSAGDLDAAREQQLLAGGLGFWAPADPTRAASYVGTNFDATGRYAARYHYEDGRLAGEAVSFSLGQAVARGATVGVEILGSEIAVELADDVWFASLSSQRELSFTLAGRSFGTHFRATRAQRAEPVPFAPQIDLADGGWSWGVLPARPRDASADFAEELRDLPLADALARYRERVAGGKLGEYGGLLRDWLRANPGRTGDVLALLRNGEFAGEQVARAGLFWALGAANTAEARAALVGVLREWPDTAHQIAAAQALAMVERPTAEMIEVVAQSAGRDDLHAVERGAMALALGALAQRSEAHSPEIAAQARAEIRGWLRGTADEAQLGHALLAAGNAGHEELAADIRPYLDHDSATLRRHATHALRNMSPETAYPRLEERLGDADRTVRTSALETAATLARRTDQAPSAAMIDLAGARLTHSHQAEERAAVSLLGEAARRGDARADALLRGHLEAQLADPVRDPQRLATLARNTPARWQAER